RSSAALLRPNRNPMTINLMQGGESRLTIRYLPLLAWLFIGVTLYGVGTLVAELAAGSRAMDGGTALGLAGLITLVLFVAVAAGQFVVCTFDRGGDQVRIARYGLHGRAVQTRPLSEVVGMDVRVLRRAQHRIELRLRSGERLSLTPYYVVAYGTGGIERIGALIGVEPVTIMQRATLRR
ncbi:hypothetical protein K2Z83_04820, partial [Oscillochloris sp. ZM17-4]|uniref:hypothetical protein n=1 Tax=Oscillochloris sp. ZM17-4 TaxID=2866714 RepID=UPI001C7342AF